jgi:hypothetical protein
MPDRRNQHTIKLNASITVSPEKKEFDLERRRAAIKAALNAAVAGLAATTSALATSALPADDGGTPPWGEVIVGPVWERANPPPGPKAEFELMAELFWE